MVSQLMLRLFAIQKVSAKNIIKITLGNKEKSRLHSVTPNDYNARDYHALENILPTALQNLFSPSERRSYLCAKALYPEGSKYQLNK
jgi:hypothetical protein